MNFTDLSMAVDHMRQRPYHRVDTRVYDAFNTLIADFTNDRQSEAQCIANAHGFVLLANHAVHILRASNEMRLHLEATMASHQMHANDAKVEASSMRRLSELQETTIEIMMNQIEELKDEIDTLRENNRQLQDTIDETPVDLNCYHGVKDKDFL